MPIVNQLATSMFQLFEPQASLEDIRTEGDQYGVMEGEAGARETGAHVIAPICASAPCASALLCLWQRRLLVHTLGYEDTKANT